MNQIGTALIGKSDFSILPQSPIQDQEISTSKPEDQSRDSSASLPTRHICALQQYLQRFWAPPPGKENQCQEALNGPGGIMGREKVGSWSNSQLVNCLLPETNTKSLLQVSHQQKKISCELLLHAQLQLDTVVSLGRPGSCWKGKTNTIREQA